MENRKKIFSKHSSKNDKIRSVFGSYEEIKLKMSAFWRYVFIQNRNCCEFHNLKYLFGKIEITWLDPFMQILNFKNNLLLFLLYFW